MVNKEIKEDSPYQIYMNLYCEECNDEDCVISNIINDIKEIRIEKIHRDQIYICSQLRNAYKTKK